MKKERGQKKKDNKKGQQANTDKIMKGNNERKGGQAMRIIRKTKWVKGGKDKKGGEESRTYHLVPLVSLRVDQVHDSTCEQAPSSISALLSFPSSGGKFKF